LIACYKAEKVTIVIAFGFMEFTFCFAVFVMIFF